MITEKLDLKMSKLNTKDQWIGVNVVCQIINILWNISRKSANKIDLWTRHFIIRGLHITTDWSYTCYQKWDTCMVQVKLPSLQGCQGIS